MLCSGKSLITSRGIAALGTFDLHVYVFEYDNPTKQDTNRWRPLTAFPLKILDNVSSIGSGGGIAASSRRGSTSKGTKVSKLYKYFKYFF